MEDEKYYCWNCDVIEIPKPISCCSGSDCCCMGLPVEPPFCSDKCTTEYFSKKEYPDSETIIEG